MPTVFLNCYFSLLTYIYIQFVTTVYEVVFGRQNSAAVSVGDSENMKNEGYIIHF